MMSTTKVPSEHEALLLEADSVLGEDPTPPNSPTPSKATGKTPTTDDRPADLAAAVDWGTGALPKH